MKPPTQGSEMDPWGPLGTSGSEYHIQDDQGQKKNTCFFFGLNRTPCIFLGALFLATCTRIWAVVHLLAPYTSGVVLEQAQASTTFRTIRGKNKTRVFYFGLKRTPCDFSVHCFWRLSQSLAFGRALAASRRGAIAGIKGAGSHKSHNNTS